MIRAVSLPLESAIAAAHGLGIHRWRDRAELDALLERWPLLAPIFQE